MISAIQKWGSFVRFSHTVFALPFALAAMVRTAFRLLDTYHLEPGWSVRPTPVRTQIGGVARSAEPCTVRYVLRH